MPRIATEQLEEGMVVVADVKNADGALLLPAGCALTARQIALLGSWGVVSIEVRAEGVVEDDPLSALSEEARAKLTEEVRASFWKADDADPVFAELFPIVLKRRARLPS